MFTRLSDEGSNQSHVHATSEPRPPLVKELLCHFAPTCTSLSPLRTLRPRAAGESKILGSVSRRSQGHPRTFRDVAETIRKSRASLSVSVIKLGRKLEYACRLFSPSSRHHQGCSYLGRNTRAVIYRDGLQIKINVVQLELFRSLRALALLWRPRVDRRFLRFAKQPSCAFSEPLIINYAKLNDIKFPTD